MQGIRRWSKLFGMVLSEPIKEIYVSKSQRLLLQYGLIQSIDGLNILSPILVKSLKKLETIVRREMDDLSAQEILLPTLINSKLFEISGRSNLPDLFKLENRGKAFILGPTHEETITQVISSIKNLNATHLPLRLYQISNKFRDEKRPKGGLLRSKEFVMKDLYCFDKNIEESEKFYKEVLIKYQQIFQILKVPFLCVKGHSGDVGGLYSDEFHIMSEAGEDLLALCKACGHKENLICDSELKDVICTQCKSTNVQQVKGIEVAHTFNLGTVYSKPFGATYLDSESKSQILQMSCYGLGLTRLLAASVEILSEENEIRWPLALSPYLVCIIPPKAGSKEEKTDNNISEKIYHDLSTHLNNDVIYFDGAITIGKRINSVKKIGIPYVVVIGKEIINNPPVVEVHDFYSETKDLVQLPDVTNFVLRKVGRFGNIRT